MDEFLARTLDGMDRTADNPKPIDWLTLQATVSGALKILDDGGRAHHAAARALNDAMIVIEHEVIDYTEQATETAQ